MKNILKNPIIWVIIGGVVVLASLAYVNTMTQDDVAMKINDTTFTYNDLDKIINQVSQEFQMYGIQATKEEIIEEAINRATQEALLIEHANELGIEVSQEEIDDYFNEVMGMYGSEGEAEFLEDLKAQGFGSRQEIEKILATEVKINKLIDYYVEAEEITEEDLEEAYRDYSEQMGSFMAMQEIDEEIPSFEEMRESLKEELSHEKITPLILNKIEELKEGATIEIFFNVDDIDVNIPEVPEMQVQPQIDFEPEIIE